MGVYSSATLAGNSYTAVHVYKSTIERIGTYGGDQVPYRYLVPHRLDPKRQNAQSHCLPMVRRTWLFVCLALCSLPQYASGVVVGVLGDHPVNVNDKLLWHNASCNSEIV